MMKVVHHRTLQFPSDSLLLRSQNTIVAKCRYHIPRAWLKPTTNSLVLLEEIGGDLSKVSVVTRSVETVCGHISESQPPPVQSWVSNLSKNVGTLLSSEVVLECPGGQNIDRIHFASFGNPSGSCGHFRHGSCHAKGTLEIVKKVSDMDII